MPIKVAIETYTEMAVSFASLENSETRYFVPNNIFNIINAVQAVIASDGLNDHCIHTCALLARALHTNGYPDAYLLTVGVEIQNPALLSWVSEYGLPQTPEDVNACDAAGGISIHLGAGHEEAVPDGMWKGHLVVVIPKSMNGRDCMIDLSVTQVNKYGYGLDIPPVMAKLKPEGSFVTGQSQMIQDVNGSRMRYTAYPADKSFNDDGDCMNMRGIELALQQVCIRLNAITAITSNDDAPRSRIGRFLHRR